MVPAGTQQLSNQSPLFSRPLASRRRETLAPLPPCQTLVLLCRHLLAHTVHMAGVLLLRIPKLLPTIPFSLAMLLR